MGWEVALGILDATGLKACMLSGSTVGISAVLFSMVATACQAFRHVNLKGLLAAESYEETLNALKP